jgi:hypothetical protein
MPKEIGIEITFGAISETFLGERLFYENNVTTACFPNISAKDQPFKI